MKLPVILSVMVAAACFGEPVSAVLDEKGQVTCKYKIDSVFPEGILVRSGGKTIWLEVAYADVATRNAIMRNQNREPTLALATGVEPALEPRSLPTPNPASVSLSGPARPMRYTFEQDYVGYSTPRPVPPAQRPAGGGSAPMAGAGSGSGNFTFNPGNTKRAASVVEGDLRAIQRYREATKDIPGVDSRRELPWEFARNEVAMWLIWFSTTDENVPGNAETNAYIAEQNTQGMLVYRLLIKPWLHNKKD